ncbi:hypothetical protein F1880_008552 [Penicillium rolfsii]|nr:hypothetical protein F1880_008552 [Penicillium rolfsii]
MTGVRVPVREGEMAGVSAVSGRAGGLGAGQPRALAPSLGRAVLMCFLMEMEKGDVKDFLDPTLMELRV